MDDATINTLIGKLEGAGLYAFDKGSEFVKVGGLAGMLAAGFFAAMVCIALAAILLRKMPGKDTYDYEDAMLTRVAAGCVGVIALGFTAIAGLEQLTYFLAPEGALIMRAIN